MIRRFGRWSDDLEERRAVVWAVLALPIFCSGSISLCGLMVVASAFHGGPR